MGKRICAIVGVRGVETGGVSGDGIGKGIMGAGDASKNSDLGCRTLAGSSIPRLPLCFSMRLVAIVGACGDCVIGAGNVILPDPMVTGTGGTDKFEVWNSSGCC